MSGPTTGTHATELMVSGAAAAVSGAFFGETAAGEWGFARIPEFRLEIPTWA